MADIWYIEVMPMQSPEDLGLDENQRSQAGFNVQADKKPSATFLDELMQILIDAGIASGSIFGGTTAVIPDGVGPYLHLRESGGPAGGRTQNVRGIAYPKPTAQIVARAETYEDAYALAMAAYNAFADVRNQNVTLP